MKHNLIFTIYSIIALIILSITYLQKLTKKETRDKIFIMLIISAFIFGIFEILSLFVFSNITENPIVTQIIWSLKIIGMFAYIYMFYVYYNIIVNHEKRENLKEVFIQTPKYSIGLIIATIVTVLYLIFNKCTYIDINDIRFVRGPFGYAMLIVSVLIVSLSVISVYKTRKENKNIFRTLLLFLILFSTSLPLQIGNLDISLMPFICTFICYIIFYNLENPDLKLVEEVKILKDEVDSSSNTKTEFLLNLSSELIAPINAIYQRTTELINREETSREEFNQAISEIKGNGENVLESIDNIFDLIESEKTKDTVNNVEYSIYDLVKTLESFTLSKIGSKPIKLIVEISDNINSKLVGDVDKIKRILQSIIINAAKYTSLGRIKIEVTCTNDDAFQMIQFKIQDTGCGIKEEEQSQVLADNKEMKTSKVGLSLAKRNVELLGGTITFNSMYRGGTTFYVNIPQKPVGTRLVKEDKIEVKENDVIEIPDCSNYKVLIVDDDDLDIKVTTKILGKYKFQLFSIKSSVECIDKIKREEVFDLIFLDHKMKDIDGVETMKILKDLKDYTIPPIIALTANAMPGAREFYLNEGFDEYLAKPIDNNELNRIVKKYCNKKQETTVQTTEQVQN